MLKPRPAIRPMRRAVAMATLLTLSVPPAHAAPRVTEARSSRQHLNGGSYAMDLALSGPRNVESRALRSDQAVVLLVFDRDLTSIGSIETSHGTVVGGSGIRSAFPDSVQIEISNLPDDGYYLTVTVNDAADASGTLPKASATVGMLIGDANGSRAVSTTDIRFVASRSGQQAATDDNYQLDINLSGSITTSDIRYTASRSGRRLPAAAPLFVGSPQDQQTTPGAATPAQPVRLDDFDTPAANLTLTAASSNPTLLPNSAITLAGSGANRSVALQPAAGQTGAATVTLTVSDGASSATRSFALTAGTNTPPRAIASAGNFLGRAPLTTTFDARRANDPDGSITAYAWDFGDGTAATGVAPVKTYNSAGTYNATLTVTDNGGLSDSVEHVITVASGAFDVNATPTRADASRLLWQAAFGPTADDLDDVVARGYAGWIDHQIGLPPSRLDLAQRDLITSVTGSRNERGNLRTGWFNRATDAPDQLRHRMAFALAQVVVLNDGMDDSNWVGSSNYYNHFVDEGLGNYRDLLEKATFSYQMGIFLTYFENRKADPDAGTTPDENYAREVIQLFSIGLVELNPDGTPRRDAAGSPIPTYDNEDIKAFARVFTGFRRSQLGDDANARRAFPMRMDPNTHDYAGKQLLTYPGAANGGVQTAVPEGEQDDGTGVDQVQFAIDNVFDHPNCGPFVARQVIQRLVVSNPTPAYVGRVAAAFNGSGPFGTGVRGDLAAVARAILLDPEARDPAYRSNPAAERVMEPLVLYMGLYRTLEKRDPGSGPGVRVTGQGFQDSDQLGQSFQDAPSVFNFYLPDYTVPNSGLDERGLVSPELQIATEANVLNSLTRFRGDFVAGFDDREPDAFDRLRTLAADPPALVDELDLMLMGGGMSPEMRARMLTLLEGEAIATDFYRARAAVWLVMASPEFIVRR